MKFFFSACILLLGIKVNAQLQYSATNPEAVWLIDRYEVLYGKLNPVYTAYKPYSRAAILSSSQRYLADSTFAKNEKDLFNLHYLIADNWDQKQDSTLGNTQKPFLKHFFLKKNAFIHHADSEFTLIANPVLELSIGKDNTLSERLINNTRGVELRGCIGQKIGFYTLLTDNQTVFPTYVDERRDSTRAVPGEGFWKNYKEGAGADYFQYRGYISFNAIKQINVQFGMDRNFIGNGYRSLILSDYAAPYLFLKLTTKVWKFKYTNLFADMTAQLNNSNIYYQRKYMALHHLSIDIRKNINIGVFENIVFQRSDSSTGNSGFEINYLNPVIFYRAVESYLGSKDKVTLGADVKWNFLKHFSVYGQFILNEFVIDNVRKQNGWWGNKYSWQIGLKYMNAFGIKNLDVQLEHNFARPFTYTDKNAETATTHYNQALAHPLGANFSEVLSIIRYQPLPKLQLNGKVFYMLHGADRLGTNYGGDLLKPYTTRTLEYGNEPLQGNLEKIIYTDFTASYMVFHNFFVDLKIAVRKYQSETRNQTEQIWMTGIRWNIQRRENIF